MILTIRTDAPKAELALYQQGKRLQQDSWEAHRELARTMLQHINDMLHASQADLKALTGIVVYKGPGSFTGLRIGISAANALAYGLTIPIVSQAGEDWIEQGIARIENGDSEKWAVPEYGAPAFVTAPKK